VSYAAATTYIADAVLLCRGQPRCRQLWTGGLRRKSVFL